MWEGEAGRGAEMEESASVVVAAVGVELRRSRWTSAGAGNDPQRASRGRPAASSRRTVCGRPRTVQQVKTTALLLQATQRADSRASPWRSPHETASRVGVASSMGHWRPCHGNSLARGRGRGHDRKSPIVEADPPDPSFSWRTPSQANRDAHTCSIENDCAVLRQD